MKQLIALENISVRGYQMLQTPTVASPIPLWPAWMLSHVLLAREGSQLLGMALVVHDTRPHIEAITSIKKSKSSEQQIKVFTDLLPHSKRGACGYMVGNDAKYGGDYSSKNIAPQSVSQQPAIYASGVFSLYVISAEEVNKKNLANRMTRMRLAGGYIDQVGHVDSHQEMPQRLAPGLVVVDASHEIQQRLSEGLDITEAMLLRRNRTHDTTRSDTPSLKEKENVTEAKSTNTNPDYLPTTVGYATLSVFKHRQGTRLGPNDEPIEFAPAEAMLGLIECKNTRGITPNEDLFWRLDWQTEASAQPPFDYCVLTQNQR